MVRPVAGPCHLTKWPCMLHAHRGGAFPCMVKMHAAGRYESRMRIVSLSGPGVARGQV